MSPIAGPGRPLRVLWLARAVPYPMTMGDRVYTAELARAAAAAGCEVRFVGFAGEAPPPAEPIANLTWQLVPGAPGHPLPALLSTMPLAAARHRTASYRALLKNELAREPWDAVVIDQYSMGWVLEETDAWRAPNGRRPVHVYVTHDHEETLLRQLARRSGASLPKSVVLRLNALKTKWIERATAKASDVVTAITSEEAAHFAANQPGLVPLVLTPGYGGRRLPERTLDATLPRRILVFGSFKWSAKQANLRQFLDAAQGPCEASGIEIEIVGSITPEFQAEIAARSPKLRVQGFVEDALPYFLSSRVAIVAEPIGGGFKMKIPELVFHRLPVATLEACVMGVPAEVKRHFSVSPDLSEMVRALPALVDDLPRLQSMQQGAYRAAETRFDWSACGTALRQAIEAKESAPA